MRSVICNFENNNNHGTAHIYKNSLNSFITFCHSSTIPFRKITPELLKGFEAYLRQKQRSWNTVSTYLRALRATYNRAVDKHLAPYIPRLFKQVYTGTRADRKKALNIKDMSRILHSWDTDEIPHSLSRTHGLFILMFMLRGLPFVDLVNLHKKDLNGNNTSKSIIKSLFYFREITGYKQYRNDSAYSLNNSCQRSKENRFVYS